MSSSKTMKPALRNLAAGDVLFREERLEISLTKLLKVKLKFVSSTETNI